MQRIEQGMGRGVRDSGDHCAVLLLGADLAIATHDPGHLALFSPATRAQLDLSREIASQIRGGGLKGVRLAVNACLDRDPQWTERSRRALANVRYADTGVIRTEAVAARQAFDLASAGQTAAAADRLQRAVSELSDPAIRGWVMQQKAAYLDLTDPAAAQAVLVQAARDNPYVLHPAAGINPGPARPVMVQARAAASFLGAEYEDGITLVLGIRSLLEEIVWDEERTDEAEATWERLGRHLGFTSSRPEQEYGTGPDDLWVTGSDRHAVTELKTGCTTDTISKHDLDQLGGSVRWDQEHYPGITPVPVMIHPSRECHPPVPGMRIITPSKLEDLKTAVRTFAVTLANDHGRWSDEHAVADASLRDGSMVARSSPPTPKQRARPQPAETLARSRWPAGIP